MPADFLLRNGGDFIQDDALVGLQQFGMSCGAFSIASATRMRITGLLSRIAARTSAKSFEFFVTCCATSSERPMDRRSPPRNLSTMLVIADFCSPHSQLIKREGDVEQAIVSLDLEGGGYTRLYGV